MSIISVIIPIYNAEDTILETVESVRQQTFVDWEIVAIDDGSTDRTLELLFDIQDERIKIFSYENSGVAIARNKGIAHASGEYIAFLDADDLWTPNKLESQLAALQANPEAGVAYSWTYDLYSDRSSEKVLFPCESIYFSGNVHSQLLIKNFLTSGSNPLIRSKAIESVGEFDPACVPCEDWDFYLRLAAYCPFVLVPEHQILYRQSSNSGSSKVEAVRKGGLLTIQKAYLSASPELQYLKKQTMAFFYQYCTQQYLKNNDSDIKIISNAIKSLWTGVCFYPQMLFNKYTQNLLLWLFKKWVLTLSKF